MSLDRTFDASHLHMNSSSNIVNKIHVLLVEHDITDHDNIMNMLRSFSYEVTSVNHASSGIPVIWKEKAHFDLVIANMWSPDSFGYQLLQLALRMNLLIVLTSNKDDAVRTMRALEYGAFLCVKKPVTMQVLQYLWQHVSMEKMSRLLKQKEALKEVVRYNPEIPALGQPNHVQDESTPVILTNKRKTQWTVELHTKFMKAARTLGPGRCYPKDILELMNVPGLSRMQVASHLQKCRARRLPSLQRKSNQEVTPPQPLPAPKRAPRARPASFGSMPLIDDVIETPCFNQLPQIQEHQEFAAFRPGQIGQEFGIDEASMHAVAGQPLPPITDAPWNEVDFGDAFGDPFVDPMMGQDFSQFLQPELGFGYNGTWQPDLLVDPDQMVDRQEVAHGANGGDLNWPYG